MAGSGTCHAAPPSGGVRGGAGRCQGNNPPLAYSFTFPHSINMKLWGWTLHRSAPPPEIVRPGASSEAEMVSALARRVNQLETAMEGVQLEHAQRQLEVLNAIEKTLHQLRAREAKRDREVPAEPARMEVPPPGNGDWPAGLGQHYRPDLSLAPMNASRFRRR